VPLSVAERNEGSVEPRRKIDVLEEARCPADPLFPPLRDLWQPSGISGTQQLHAEGIRRIDVIEGLRGEADSARGQIRSAIRTIAFRFGPLGGARA
jgi:hypothetical protein